MPSRAYSRWFQPLETYVRYVVLWCLWTASSKQVLMNTLQYTFLTAAIAECCTTTNPPRTMEASSYKVKTNPYPLKDTTCYFFWSWFHCLSSQMNQQNLKSYFPIVTICIQFVVFSWCQICKLFSAYNKSHTPFPSVDMVIWFSWIR